MKPVADITYARISLKKGREWQIKRGHPWLFAGAISQLPKNLEAGAIADLLDTSGRFVARGYYNPATDIAVRVLSLQENELIDQNFIETRVQRAYALRQKYLDFSETNVFRLINAEGDGLPGFIVDYFDGVLVVQSHTAGADRLSDQLIDALKKVISPKAIVLRKDASVRKREGLSLSDPELVWGELGDDIVVRENNLLFKVNVLDGQKTGFFADQRDKRLSLSGYLKQLRPGARVLNCFCYTAAFSVYILAANKALTTINVDISESALIEAKENFKLNGIASDGHEFVKSDAFDWLKEAVQKKSKYDCVILDPPAFAKSQKDKLSAAKAYTRLFSLGMQLTEPQGLLVLCSCSGSVSLEEFQDCIRQASVQSGKTIQVLETFLHGLDHPVLIAQPEGQYLKVIFCRLA